MRTATLTLALLGTVSMLAFRSAAAEDAAPTRYRVYFGTYTDGDSQGIYQSEFDLAGGELSAPELAAEVVNPSFLAIHPSRKFLYAVSEISLLDGQTTGGVSGFAIDRSSGQLKLLNQQSSQGAGPCHLSVDATGSVVVVANYGGGSVASLPVSADGRLGPAASAIQHEGHSIDPGRQEGPHAHSINIDPENRFAVAADLGLDKVLIYRLDAKAATLAPHDPPSVSVAGGSGPRHFAFHPSGRFAYVINEMANTVTAFSYEAGTLKELQTIGTLPADFSEASYTSEVQVHPSGKFLYGSNRGHDSIAIFAIDQETGRLTAAGHQSTGGKAPRNFGIDPTGAYLLAANQASNNVVVFRIDGETGGLTPTGQEIRVVSPVCVKFLPL